MDQKVNSTACTIAVALQLKLLTFFSKFDAESISTAWKPTFITEIFRESISFVAQWTLGYVGLCRIHQTCHSQNPNRRPDLLAAFGGAPELRQPPTHHCNVTGLQISLQRMQPLNSPNNSNWVAQASRLEKHSHLSVWHAQSTTFWQICPINISCGLTYY